MRIDRKFQRGARSIARCQFILADRRRIRCHARNRSIALTVRSLRIEWIIECVYPMIRETHGRRCEAAFLRTATGHMSIAAARLVPSRNLPANGTSAASRWKAAANGCMIVKGRAGRKPRP